jgi:hypothetical protein
VAAPGVGARRRPGARGAAERGDLTPAEATERGPQRAAHREGEEDLQRVAHGHRRSLTPMAIDFTPLLDVVSPDVVSPDVVAGQAPGPLESALGDVAL